MKCVRMKCLWVALLVQCVFIPMASAEVMLQWFGTTWSEMTDKMPILAELGYGSIYAPVPNKAGSQWSVGYDVYDRFDLGHLDRNGISTQYGTMQELLRMVETAHRFGIRIYFDNVMNHNAYLAPGESDEVPIDFYPDMSPEDFHVVKDGYYYTPSGDIEGWMYDSGFHEGVQHYRLSGLLDIANESGSLGYNWDQPGQPVHSYIRQPNEPDKYPDRSLTPISSGGIDIYPFNGTNGTPVAEDVNGYLNRAVRWMMDVTKCDGIRFDAAKHVYPPFFGSQNDDFAGYCGSIQAQYNLTHGMGDSNNRDSAYDVDRPRDDALLFGECVPHTAFDAYDYYSRGMRMLDFYYEGTLSGTFRTSDGAFGYGDMRSLLDYGPLGAANGVIQSQNHDHEQDADLDMMYAYAILRDGIPLVYTDGNHHSLPDEFGRAFPTYGRGDFLGQYQNPALTDMLDDIITRPGPQSEISRNIWIHEQFSRGQLWNKYQDEAVLVNERVQTYDYDRAQSYDGNEGTVLLTGFCDNKDEWGSVKLGPWGTGDRADLYTDFRPGTLLFNYATVLDGMYPLAFTRVEADWRVNIEVPPGHYVAYGMMVPGRSHPGYAPDGMSPILVQQPGDAEETMATYRVDTPQGDSDWDNDGVPNEEDPITIPRISGTNQVRFVSISDGLSATAMIKIDGGIDINGGGLDNPPGVASDIFLGYEPMYCLHKRHYANDWYFYKHDHAPGYYEDSTQLYWAITSDMDSDPTNDISDAGSDFSTRAEYDAEYDAWASVTNFSEGYHIARTRIFRKRAGGPNDGADIFNTFKQTFYVDRELPTGAFAYPRAGETLWSSEYGMVFRTDDTVTRVEVHIVDGDATNDDVILGVLNGNGTATNGSGEAWAEAARVSPYPPNLVTDPDTTNAYSTYPREWKFTYRNIPSSGSATIYIKLYEDSSESFPSHVTILASTHNCQAPDYQLQFEYPQDGDEIAWTNYNVIIKFSDSLPQDAERLSLLIDNVFIPRENYQFYDSGGGYHWMHYNWTNYNRGNHGLSVYYSPGWPNDHELEASVTVKATEAISFVRFIQPQAVDNNGQATVIKLPSPIPSTSSTNYPILVETSDDVQTMHLRISDTSLTNFPWSVDATPVSTNLERVTWTYNWTVTTNQAGTHKMIAEIDTDGNPAVYELETSVSPRLEFWQFVDENDADSDDDDDGIPDGWNTTNSPGEAFAYDLMTHKPTANTWDNGDIHQYFFCGKTDPLSPDTDNDGLPDGLELGIGGIFDAGTDPLTDTDGDGTPNFVGDQDPPIYNSWYNKLDEGYPYLDGENQLQMILGSVTDPAHPDTDRDGLPDGIEDANINGRWDWPDETNPNDPDTEGDGLLDGSEDKNHDGDIAGDTNGNRLYDAGEAWTETDPLTADTDGDGMPDGWEQGYGLDPLDNGIDSLRTALPDDGDPDHGADGDPDEDTSINSDEYANDTNPMFDESSAGNITARTIHIGPGPSLGTLGGEEYFEMFSDWQAEDCHKLDFLDDSVGIGSKTDPAYAAQAEDGYATSRDIIAFYSRDGGPEQGKYYFRIDVQDLQYQAEEGYVDFYIAIKLGDPDTGAPKAFPDEINTSAEHGWDVVVGIYESGIGAVYVGDLGAGNAYFMGSHFRSDYDAVELAISRQALFDAGWNGFSDLHYQVFTVKDGACDSCGGGGGPGAGDIGGQADITDAIMDDARGWDGLLKGYLSSGWSVNRAKVALLMHANRSADPASTIQELIYNDDTSPAVGYHRHLAAHTLFDRPSSLHLSGTLASAMQWAKSDTDPQKDGVAFNELIATEIREGRLGLLPGPYADVSLPYLNGDALDAAIGTGRDVLTSLYDVDLPNWWDVFWMPNQATDGATLKELANKGIYFTVIDQWTHLFNWFSRQAAISTDGYNIQEINGMKCFAISQAATDELFTRHDSGLSLTLRNLLHAKALQGWTDQQRAQVVVIRGEWDSLGDADNASAYDHNLDWMVNHPWIQLVTLEEIAKGEIDITGDDQGDHWPTVNHGTDIVLNNRQASPFIQFAAEYDFDNWYYGSAGEESLYSWRPLLQGAGTVSKDFGHLDIGGTLLHDTWQQVNSAGSSEIGNLGRMVFFSAIQQTAWHDEDATDSTRWSDGNYIHLDTTYDSLAGWAKTAHAHVREAGIYGLIDAWAGTPPNTVVRTSLDVDNDGELESVLYNNRIYAVMEDNGGRITAAFVRDPDTSQAYQIIGNLLAYPDAEGEEEGTTNVDGSSASARRTSALKDWWGTTPATSQYINDLYTPTTIANGWQFTSSDAKIVKLISLATLNAGTLDVSYTVDASLGTQYIRCGLTPNLYDLALHGQQNLSDLIFAGSVASLTNNDYSTTVSARIILDTGASFSTNAVDHEGGFASRNMRNQAYVQQVELYGQNSFSFQLALSADQTDTDGDTIPNDTDPDDDNDGFDDTIELLIDPLTGLPQSDPYVSTSVPIVTVHGITRAEDPDDDGDGMLDLDEVVAGTDPHDANSLLRFLGVDAAAETFQIEWSTIGGRNYTIEYLDERESDTWTPLPGVSFPIWEDSIEGQEATEILENNDIFEAHPLSWFRIRVQEAQD